MPPLTITCKSCGNQAREGHQFCPACAAPLQSGVSADSAGRVADQSPGIALAFTDAWDSVLPRLQNALFGDFVISRELGRGGMAAVFLAHQLKLDRKVAIKVMAPTLMSGLGLADRFRDEATTVARLDHPNIISIYEVREAAGLQFFIMQYVAGRSLERALRQYGRLPVPVVRAILFEVGSALAYAHRREVIHRDVKPGNVLLSLDGRVIVGDFGIAKVAASSSRTQTGAVVGTPTYMSPEQCWGTPLTWSADQYSLGVVAFEILTGVPPFGGTGYGIMRSHTEEQPPDLVALRPDCPPEMAAAVARMLAKRPDDRFPSMSAALTALGASRFAVDEAAQDAIGQLAVPLPEEAGVVIVHTPASPAPLRAPAAPADALPAPLPPPPAARTALRDRVSAVRRRVMAAMHAMSRSLGAWSAGTWAAIRGMARLPAMRGAHPTRATAAIASGIALVLAIVVVIALAKRGAQRSAGGVPQATTVDTSVKSHAQASASEGNVPTPVDTTPLVNDADSTSTIVDSAAASSLVLARRPASRSTTLLVGDSVLLIAELRDRRRQIVSDAAVIWRLSDTLVMRRAASGWLHALAAGSVTVRASVDTLEQARRFVVRPRPATQSIAAAPHTDSAPSAAVDPAADREAIDRAVGSFVRGVLEAGDTAEIRRLYRPTSPGDADTRDEFVRQLTTKRNVTVRPEQNPPPPVIAGNRAHADVRITMRVNRSLGRRDETRLMALSADLARSGDRWVVTGFTLAPGR